MESDRVEQSEEQTCASYVRNALQPGICSAAGLGSDGIVETVRDNALYQNRSTGVIVKWLVTHGYSGISIDAEELQIMKSVPALVRQLGPAFKTAGLGLAVSAPWPERGVTRLYGDDAVQAFNEHVDAIELQDYSDDTGTPGHGPKWISDGIKASILMGGVCTENSDVQTSLEDTQGWTRYAMSNGLRGMFSWRLDNDHGNSGHISTMSSSGELHKTTMHCALLADRRLR